MQYNFDHEMPGWNRQTIPDEGKPHGWIQFKGTNICIDIHCICGNLGHVDGDFVYYVMCAACKRVYMVNGHVELVELTEEEKSRQAFKLQSDQLHTTDIEPED